MLDLGNSFLASIERDPHALGDRRWAGAADLRAMVSPHFRGRRRLRRARPRRRRPSGHGAAKPLGSGDHPLGLPVRRHHLHADQLALQGRRDRLLRRGFASQGDRVRGRVRRRTAPVGRGKIMRAHRARPAARRRDFIPNHDRARGRGGAAARRRRRLVGHALYLGHDREAEGRAAPAARRAGGGGRACGAKPVRLRRTHARRHAALSHHGRALAPRHVADRRRLRLPAALRGGEGARPHRGRADHQPLSGADALSRPRSRRAFRQDRCALPCASSASPARR